MNRKGAWDVVFFTVIALSMLPIIILNTQAAEKIKVHSGPEPFNQELETYTEKQQFIIAMSPGEQTNTVVSDTNEPKSDKPDAGNNDAIKRGAGLYGTNCSFCHGGGGKGGRCPQLIHGAWAPDGPNSDRVMLNIISKGRKGTAMGAFEKHLSEEQIFEMIAYLRNEAKKHAEKQKNEPEEDTFRR